LLSLTVIEPTKFVWKAAIARLTLTAIHEPSVALADPIWSRRLPRN